MTPMDVQKIRKLFPVTKKWIYLNHAAVAPLSTRVVAAMDAFLHDQLENGAHNWKAWFATYARARALLASLLNANAEEIAFVKNTSEGVSLIANGLGLGRGDEVVLAKPEFPSNLYPWMALERRGVRIHWIHEKDGRVPFDAIRRAIAKRPKVLALSFVEFLSGYRNDLVRLGELCADHSVFFFVDAIQGLGAFPLDVRAAHISALAGDGKKWLMGPEGAAFLYVSQDVLDRIEVTEHGWTSVRDPGDHRVRNIEYPAGARRLEPGGLNTVGLHGLVAALELAQEIGVTEISERLLALTGRLCDGLRSKGYQLLSPRGENEGSGIVSFRHASIPSDQILAQLAAESIIGAIRLGYVRLSPHYYILEDEIDRALSAIP